MDNPISEKIADTTPVIVGAGQWVERIQPQARPPFSSPMQLASRAASAALADAGGDSLAANIDTIAVVRLFSDSGGNAWRCPFGGSDNPPESIAQRIGATPTHRVYSSAGGTQPLQLLAEMFGAIARGEKDLVLLAGAEAIASQRFAQRNELDDDWSEHFDLPLENREYRTRMVAAEELRGGLNLPMHYYALIENYRAHRLGNDLQRHRQHMARLLAPFSRVAADNPYAWNPRAYDARELAAITPGNYLTSLPYSRLLVAQDGVNQAAALLLTSAGRARQLGIDPRQWIFLQGYAEGSDQYLFQRADPGRSAAMEQVFRQALDMAMTGSAAVDYLDIYSCFPCAVEAACEALALPTDGSRCLTLTGGMPFFGGPGNNYSMHALAEMARRLRGSAARGLVTANGGMLSKHAAAILSNRPAAPGGELMNWANPLAVTAGATIPALPVSEVPTAGVVISYTLIERRGEADRGVVLGQTTNGERFVARCADQAGCKALRDADPIGRAIRVTTEDQRHTFTFSG